MDFDPFDPSGQDSPQGWLSRNIIDRLEEIAVKEGLEIEALGPGHHLENLSEALFAKYGTRVVILVDEHDAPILNNMANAEIARASARVLHGFYASFKEADEHIRFVFITGISQFSRLAIGQSTNNFTDISLDKEYSDACGFTAEDLDALFGDRYEDTLAAFERAPCANLGKP
jgi:hypothetical protein